MDSLQTQGKFCVMCGVDCSGRPRTKDRRGRYFCQPCYEKAAAQARARAAGKTPAGTPPNRAAKPTPKPRPRPADGDVLASLADLESSGTTLETQRPCPGCGANMESGTVTCKACGYNVRTGRRAAPEAAARPRAPGSGSKGGSGGVSLGGLPASLTSPAVLGLIQAVIILGLFGLAKMNDGLIPLYMLVTGVYGFGIGIWILVAAFREGVGTGFMCLCIPFYAIYFVFSKSGNPHLQVSTGVSVLGSLLEYFAMPMEDLTEF